MTRSFRPAKTMGLPQLSPKFDPSGIADNSSAKYLNDGAAF